MKKITLRTLLIATVLTGIVGFEASSYAAADNRESDESGDVKEAAEYVEIPSWSTMQTLVIRLARQERFEEVKEYVINNKIEAGDLDIVLKIAVNANNKGMVSWLIDYGVPVSVDHDASEPITHAAISTDTQAEPVAIISNDIYYLDHAFHGNCVTVIEPLVKAGASIKNSSQDTVIMVAARYGHIEVLHELIRLGMDVHEVRAGKNALSDAVLCDHLQMAKELLRLGVDHTVVDSTDRRSLLMIAAENGNRDMVKLLVDAGVPINATDAEGRNALSYALRYYGLPNTQTGNDLRGTEDWEGRQKSMIRLMIRLLLMLGVEVDYSTLDLSDPDITVEEIKDVLACEIAAVHEAGAQDWMPGDLLEKNGVLDQASAGISAVAGLMADLTTHGHENSEIQEAIMARIQAARECRLAPARVSEAQVKKEADSVKEQQESAAALPASTVVDVDAEINNQLQYAYNGDGVRCFECGTIQADEGFYECNVCGARI